ncbi:MAG: hypothetical protein ACOC9B_05015 [Chloroflexota bacterium]
MWAFAITEERGSDSRYVLQSACDFETAKATMLSYLAAIIHFTKMGMLADTKHFCNSFMESLLGDGQRLSDMEDGTDWGGSACACDKHDQAHRMDYWVRYMSDEQFAETEAMFKEAYPDGDIFTDRPPAEAETS